MLAGAAAALMLLSGCGGTDRRRWSGAPASAPVAAVVEVHLTCATGDTDAPCAFRPAEVTIRAGGTVRWVNDDATYHTVTSTGSLDRRAPDGRFDAVLDMTGARFQRTFAEPGTYPYYCQPHSEFMTGTVHVLAR
jgi:plastocyanin